MRHWVFGGPHLFESSENTGLIHVLLQGLKIDITIIDKCTILQFSENIPLASDFLRVLN